MNKKLIFSSMFLVLNTFSFTASAAEKGLDGCIAAAQKQQTGAIIRVEKLNVAGKTLFELEVLDSNKVQWELMCDAAKAKIIEVEHEAASADSEEFKKNLKVTEADAKAIALKAHPGNIEEIEYEIEANGDASFEIDIVNAQNIETKVEVDAATGKIIETATELWEIGAEPN